MNTTNLQAKNSARIHTTFIQQTGSYHLLHQQPCEDILDIRESSNFCFYGIADGQTGKSQCRTGAASCLASMAEYTRRYSIRNLITHPFPDELPYMMMREIRSQLLLLSQKNHVPLTEYSSTLLTAAIDPCSGYYILSHLGDGCIIGVTAEDSITIQSPPENGLTPQSTWLTTTPNAIPHLRLTFGSITNLKRLVLLSDGARALYHGKHISRTAQGLLLHGTASEIKQQLTKAVPSDDLTCIILDFIHPLVDIPIEQALP